ncbi:hypothetical protein CYK19_06330 [Streptococcus mitis]|jgi:hypothetical protein|uniref:Uncharacterized protein n=2 Tax=Streptococcus TaxID=1301 RepID=A0A2N6P545_STROR|nr:MULTISPECIES: hypothetical protein [Streptococcus]PKZ98507.1 hypothetical protein CYK19_06330 [Streptococcus mitis]PMB85813.1 hypothetical protein CK799_06370 [Streptococcus oralis subsp. dentisani]
MNCLTLQTSGLLLGVSDSKDFETGVVVGATFQIGSRTANGRFTTHSIKVMDVNASDFIKYLDSVVTLTLSNTTISSYVSGNSASLSIKADSVKVSTAS